MIRMFRLAAAAVAAIVLMPVASARSEAPVETTEKIFEQALPNVPGKMLVALEVDYPPGGASPAHRHPASSFVFAYVLSGEIVSAVDDGAPRTYRAGESWHEIPGARHRVSRNASATQPARLLAIFVVDHGETQLVSPESP